MEISFKKRLSSSTIYLKLVLAMCIWGGTFVPARVLSQEFSAITISFYRFLISSIFLLLVLVYRGEHRLKWSAKNIVTMSVLGLTGVFAYNVFFFLGLQTVAAGKSSVIISMNPAVTAIFATIFLKEVMTWKKLLGVILALFGVITVIGQGDFSSLFHGGFSIGEIFLLGSVTSWVIYTIVGKIILKEFTSLQATTWAFVFGTLFIFPFAYFEGALKFNSQASFLHWTYLLYLGVFGSAVAFLWFYDGVKVIGAAKAASFINISPIVGVLSGVLLLGEKINLSLLVGGTIVAIGVVLINRK